MKSKWGPFALVLHAYAAAATYAKARVGLGQLTSEGSKWKLTSEGSKNKNELKFCLGPRLRCSKAGEANVLNKTKNKKTNKTKEPKNQITKEPKNQRTKENEMNSNCDY